MFEKMLLNESLPIEMIEPVSQHQGRNLIVWAANLAFSLSAIQYQNSIRVKFSDLTYLNYRHLETMPEYIELATEHFFDALGTEKIGNGYYLQPGDSVTVGKQVGMEVRARNGRVVPDAFPIGANALIKLDEDLAPIHFSVNLTQPHIAVVRDFGGGAGTYVQERNTFKDSPER